MKATAFFNLPVRNATHSAARSMHILICLLLICLASAPASAAPVPANIKQLLITPDKIDLIGGGDSHGLLVTAITTEGRMIDVTRAATYRSKQPAIVTISATGLCQSVADGEAQITASFAGQTAIATITSRDSGSTQPPSFRNHITPLLTRFGCNQGACHGKLAGQNGFRLSLRGYAPEQDYDWITREYMGRRVNLANPADSPLIRKPLTQAPHEGGQLFSEKSRAHQMLLDWVTAGAPGEGLQQRKAKKQVNGKDVVEAGEPNVVKIDILPGNRHLKPGEQQQLLVRATYSDQTVRDVTWLTQFFAADNTVVHVDEHGLVACKAAGESAIRAQFDNQVEVVIITSPREMPVDDKLFPAPANVIDQHVFAKLKSLRIPPSPGADDQTFMRRAYLDTIGTLPTPEEVTAFLADTRSDKRAKLVDDLLNRPAYVDYWTLQLADLFQNRKERDHDVRTSKGVRQFHGWLRSQVAANKPWDQLAREVLTASGDVTENPAVGYFITTVGEKRPADRSEVVASVAQAFLGTRIGCAQCHNHPSEKYTQDDYYHFAAFFARVNLERKDPYQGATVLGITSERERNVLKDIEKINAKIAELAAKQETDEKKIKENEKHLADQKKQLENKQRELADARMPKAHQPRTNAQLMPQPLDRSVLTISADGDGRKALADWMTRPDNPHFTGSMVNRLWKHFMRTGLVEPVDDLRASNPPSNPELFRTLSSEFAGHGFDLKHIMRLILNSRSYQLSSSTLPGNELDVKFHSHYYAKRLPAEVLLDAVSQATLVPDHFPGYPLGIRAIQLPDPAAGSYFLTMFGRSDRVTACACERVGEVTLPQLLHLQNGDVMNKTRDGEGRLMSLIKNQADDSKIMDTLFLATLSRLPREEERKAVTAALTGAENREEAMQDLFWALMNAKEFAFNH